MPTAWPEWATWLVAAVSAAGLLFWSLPWTIQAILRTLLAPFYRFRLVGVEHLARTGPCVMASNHVTWLDGFFLAAISPRHGQALVNADFIDRPVIRAIARRMGLIAVPSKGPRAQRAAIAAAQGALDRGELLLIFPEAQLTRNGLLGAFYRGLEVMLKGRDDVPVVPVYIHHAWGSRWSCAPTRRPARGRREIIVAFGPPVAPPITAFAVRQAVQAASLPAARAIAPEPFVPETVELDLPHLRHPELGLLTASTADHDRNGIKQTGRKPGTLGQALPGVALRVAGPDGADLPPDTPGRLLARTPAHPDEADTGLVGQLDRDGFLTLVEG
jgi:1-acyl-sn-glycerol-3-phosphate acyltransferase